MRQEGRDQFANHVLACSLHGVFSHSGSLSGPGWPMAARVRNGSLLNKRRLLGTFCHLSKHRSPPSDWLPARLCRKSVKKSVRKRLGHKMETDQMSRSIVPEGLSWALNTSWTDPLRRTAANPDYGVVIEYQLAGILPSDKRSLCYHEP